ncbi:MAG: CDP-alcohol phosphatidyltransferase family protein [Candidatus Nitrosocaldus sp.]
MSANKVTLLFIFTGVVGSLLLALGDYTMFILGALLIELAIILDCVDGNIARVKGSTVLGNTLDTWGGEITLVLSMSMLGIGLSTKDDLLTIVILRDLSFHIESGIFTYIGFFAALSTLAAWAVKNNWQVIIKRIEGLVSVPRRSTFIIENIFHYSGAYSVTMLISAILNILDFFLLLVGLVYTINLFVIIYTIVKKAYSLDKSI